MFGEANAEMKIIESILGNIPIIGLYANGEISNNRLYSYTGVLTLFT
jgi:small ligand-binding sensory domain FIST